MEHAGKKLTGNLVHVRNHQQQTLRSCIGCGEGTCLKRAVNRTCSTAFALHFLHEHCLAEDVLTSCRSPFIHIFSHCGGRGDRIDSGNLCEHIRDMRSSLVAVTGQEFLFLTHKTVIYLDFGIEFLRSYEFI